MFFDDLPIWGFIGKVEKLMHAGEKPELRYYLFTHIHFDIHYNSDRVIEARPDWLDPLPRGGMPESRANSCYLASSRQVARVLALAASPCFCCTLLGGMQARHGQHMRAHCFSTGFCLPHAVCAACLTGRAAHR